MEKDNQFLNNKIGVEAIRNANEQANNILHVDANTSLHITDIEIYLVGNNSPLKAFVSVVINNCFCIHDIKIIRKIDSEETGGSDMFLSFPSKRSNHGGFKDVIHPINSATRKAFEQAIFTAYDEARINEQMQKESEGK